MAIFLYNPSNGCRRKEVNTLSRNIFSPFPADYFVILTVLQPWEDRFVQFTGCTNAFVFSVVCQRVRLFAFLKGT